MAVVESERHFVHVQHVQLTASITDTVGDKSTAAGVLAVSLSSSNGTANPDDEHDKLLRWELAVEGCDTLFVKEHSMRDISKDVKLDLSALPAPANLSQESSLLPQDIANFFWLLNLATANDSEYQISFHRTSGGTTGSTSTSAVNTTAVSTTRVTLKERMKSGMVRLLWSNDLVADATPSVFALVQRLVQERKAFVGQRQADQEQYARLKLAHDGWKDTATRLEGGWESEKSMQFQSFCDLYTAMQETHKARATQYEEDITRLNKQVTELQQRQLKSKAPTLPDCLQHVPDDVDRGMYDAETVQRLALGQPVPLTTTSSSGASILGQKRRNPLTGATEYFDAEAALADVLVSNGLPPVPTAKKARTRRTTDSTAKMKTNQAKIARETRTKIPKREDLETEEGNSSLPVLQDTNTDTIKPIKIKATKKKTSMVDTIDKEAGSDDDDFVDKDMDAEIMADLLSLRPPS